VTAALEQSAAVERFVCELYRARLTRGACADRHLAARTPWSTKSQSAALRESHCRECAIGAAHTRGEVPSSWPGGSPIEIAPALGTVPPPRPAPVRALTILPPAAETRSDDDMAGTIEISHDGITDSLEGWGRRIGLTGAAIGQRMRRDPKGGPAAWLAPKGGTPPKRGSGPSSTKGSKSPAPRTKRTSAVAAKVARDTESAAASAAAPPHAAPVAGSSGRAVELLARLGWSVEDLGLTPGGRLFLVRETG
jgi:hypothetical protein